MRDSDSDQNFQNPLKRKWYDYQPSSFLRFIAILCIGGSSILSAALRVSQYSHYIAIVFGYITVVALLYNTFHDRLISFRVFGSLSAVALLLAGALAYYIGPNFPKKQQRMDGYIQRMIVFQQQIASQIGLVSCSFWDTIFPK
jgi:hypothetical protein